MHKHLIVSALNSLVVLAVTSAGATAFAANSFLERVTENYLKLADEKKQSKPRSPSEPSYVAIADLFRGQDEISVDNSMAKLGERETLEHIVRQNSSSEFDRTYTFKFDHGRSAIPADDPIEVVKGRQGYLVVDGHHEVYMSLFAGAETVPVKIKMDLSHLSPEDFWKQAIQQNLMYLKASQPEKMAELFAENPPRIDLAQDNPHRYLISLLAMKVGIENNQVTKTKGAKNPIWMKLPNERPFIEFYLARVLADAGISYQTSWGENVPSETIEQARQALLKAQETNSHSYVREVTLLPNSTVASSVRESFELTQKMIESDRPRKCQGVFR